MKILKINTIKKYKSFEDFSWHRFCNTEEFNSETNIFYGENGSGKSSICNIFKSASQNKSFSRYQPEDVKFQTDNSTFHYVNDVWDNTIQKNSMLFFDREFVDSNIQLGRNRGTQQGEQEQESGKLIIEFDSEAIKQRALKDDLAEVKEAKNIKLNEYQNNNKEILTFNLSDDERSLFFK